MEIRKTRQRLHTLERLAEAGASHGFEIASRANLKQGTVYGILMAFEQEGYVESAWEPDAPPGRPPRKLYRLTERGCALLAEYQAHFGPEVARGVLGSVTHDLHTAIDQVWGGIFRIGVNAERERHRTAGGHGSRGSVDGRQ